jgi:hypothetical protein
MPKPTDGLDPRSAWRWIKLVARLTPRWLLRSVSGITVRIMIWRYRDLWNKLGRQHLQFHLWIDGTNADVYCDHVQRMLDVLGLHGPVYLRWLRSGIDALLVNQFLIMLKQVTVADYNNRVLILHPYTVWKVSAEELALYLVAEATSLRLGRTFSQTRAGRIRAVRRQYEEMVACARVLPHADALVARWETRLAAFNTQFPEAAA